MKAWCQSVFLVMCTHTHTKQTRFQPFLATAESLGVWQQSPGLVCDGFSHQSLCIGILSATLYFPISLQFLGVLLRCQALLTPPEQAFWLTFPQMVPCSFSHASNFTPGIPFFTSSPTSCPSWSSLGLLVSGSLRPLETDLCAGAPCTAVNPRHLTGCQDRQLPHTFHLLWGLP